MKDGGAPRPKLVEADPRRTSAAGPKSKRRPELAGRRQDVPPVEELRRQEGAAIKRTGCQTQPLRTRPGGEPFVDLDQRGEKMTQAGA